MALQKTKTYPNGTTSSYHKITAINFEEGKESMVKLTSFLSQDTRNSGMEPMETVILTMVISDKADLFGEAYRQLKASRMAMGALISPEETEQQEDGTFLVTKQAVYEEVETNFFADAIDI